MIIYTYYLKHDKQTKKHIGGGGGCNPKKHYPSLTFSRVGVGFFWVLLGFFGFFWVFKKLIIFADFLYTQCENMHML